MLDIVMTMSLLIPWCLDSEVRVNPFPVLDEEVVGNGDAVLMLHTDGIVASSNGW